MMTNLEAEIMVADLTRGFLKRTQPTHSMLVKIVKKSRDLVFNIHSVYVEQSRLDRIVKDYETKHDMKMSV